MDQSLPSITEFFTGSDVFITGGSGFMGKVLVEKLVRSIPEMNRVFVLIRPKKGMTCEERLDKIKSIPLFGLISAEHPESLKKIIPISGDCSMMNLGLSDEDVQLMSNVSVVFHVAASVRFDDPLKQAILLNTRGTQQVMEFALNLKNLKVVMHVSTTYCNPEILDIHEHIYPPKCDWRKAVKIAEHVDEDVLNKLTQKFTKYQPNTYTFTKGLAEQVCRDYQDKLPLVVFRPSIVISAMTEPLPGWVDNFNGPVGLLVACGIGIMRTMYSDPDNVMDFTPVDTCIKAMIVAAWKRGTLDEVNSLPFYNCSTSNLRKVSTGYIIEIGKELAEDFPLDRMLWRPGGSITRCFYWNFIRFFLFHICAAVIVDRGLTIGGNKPFLLKLQRKIYEANLALSYFIHTTFTFNNVNFMNLLQHIHESDKEKFQFSEYITADIRAYFIQAMLGARRYLMHGKDEDLPKARRYFQKLKLLDGSIKVGFYLLVLYIILFKYEVLRFAIGLFVDHKALGVV